MKRAALLALATSLPLLWAAEAPARPLRAGVPGPGGAYDPRGRYDPRGVYDPRGPYDPRGAPIARPLPVAPRAGQAAKAVSGWGGGKGYQETGDDRKQLKDDLEDADNRGDVAKARMGFRQGVRDEFWDD